MPVAILLLLTTLTGETPELAQSIAANRIFNVLDAASATANHRQLMEQVAAKLGIWTIYIDAVAINGKKLKRLARKGRGQPFERVVREGLARPIDVEDFLFFLDDVLWAGEHGLRGQMVWIPASRARKHGIFIHPDDVFAENKPRIYGQQRRRIAIDKPRRPHRVQPAANAEPLGPRWTARYKNPSGYKKKLRAIEVKTGTDFAKRVDNLLSQLRNQGAKVILHSTLRDPRRGYLMWGAYVLRRAKTELEQKQLIDMLEARKAEWLLDVDIRWRHPDGWQATAEAARRMADAYHVVYATETGARESNHYSGTAVDLSAFALPRRLTLQAPDGATQSFDLSEATQSRDLNLSPVLVDWIETHFHMQKLRFDYPHWNDVVIEAEKETQ